MNLKYRGYRREDMMKVRRFLMDSYSRLKRPNSWLIDRWEFEIFFGEARNGRLEEWERQVGLWEDESGQLAGVACLDGDMYFQLDTLHPHESLVAEMLDYYEVLADHNISHNNVIHLVIPEFMSSLEALVKDRGYVQAPGGDTVVSIELDRDFTAELPPGFALHDGQSLSDRDKAVGHIMAFNYPHTEDAKWTLESYGELRKAPGYRPELDLAAVNGRGEVVSFCNIFWDDSNRIGMLEPVGTHVDYRRLGLGRAVIYEGLNRLRAMCAVKAYTGPVQPFYEAIGFKTEVTMKRWRRKR
ncbi:GNAT superfamily N-acetyltransferase [Paenibacillus forsythiae]|uniref:GNAT superfamily N-acetyltransferase n=1 Tax=Paenibacillus forsythiae TaxID=365616 RepID=A0ABU3H6G4_9BACL|nr:GNAT family N-acetyltransferase [Paenibacillus forsythiae]MDT3426412.1 GNAT superfamily N-acetyltransferase [Paenibacillus forsythiae]